MRRIFLLLLALCLLSSCSQDKETSRIGVASWNLGAFFDERDDGTEFPSWRFSSGWNGEKYRERVKKTVQYIASNLSDADVIILEEVESSSVLKDLAEGGLKQHGYLYFGLAQKEEGALSVGFISKIKPQSIELVTVPEARPMLLLSFCVNGEKFSVLGVHLRSRLMEENTDKRKEELELIRNILENATSPIMALGDFNIDPLLHKGEMESERNNGSEGAVIILSGDGSKGKSGVFYSPFLDYASPLSGGTYFFEGEWERLDNVILPSSFFDGRGIEYIETRIVKGSGSTDYSGRPMMYDKNSGKGLSDHFALIAFFQL